MSDFDEYKRLGEPEKYEKAENWEIAIGLQAVDGLKPSEYLLELARKNIEGEITIDEVKESLENYYEAKKNATVNPQNATVKGENATVKLSATQGAILELLSGNGRLTADDIADDIGKDVTTIKRAIKGLKEKGCLERIGSDKKGYWKVKRHDTRTISY